VSRVIWAPWAWRILSGRPGG